MFWRVQCHQSTVQPPFILHIAMKTINGTKDEHGLAPCRLVCGIIWGFLVLSTDFSNQKRYMKAIESLQANINSIASKGLVKNAVINNILTAVYRKYNPEEEEMLYFEQKKLWDWPFIVIHTERKIFFVHIMKKTVSKNFNVFCVKPIFPKYEQNL